MDVYFKQHCRRYPQRTWQDDIKWFYQAQYGCESSVLDFNQNLINLKKENGTVKKIETEILSADYLRVHFSGLSETEMRVLDRLVLETQAHVKPIDETWQDKIKQYVHSLPSKEQAEALSYCQNDWIEPSHSDLFIKAYEPHYHVVLKKYWPYFNLLCQIENIEQGVIGIDGRCGSGKSTLGKLISRLYHCPLIHMDDFYLPLSMRTKERLSQPGGNVYYERFKKEVADAIHRHQTIDYGIFDHRIMDVNQRKIIAPAKMYVVEGSYAFHPTLIDLYDFKIFLTISPEAQKIRIIQRNGAEDYLMFESRWIPLEERYFQARDFSQIADVVLDVTNMVQDKS